MFLVHAMPFSHHSHHRHLSSYRFVATPHIVTPQSHHTPQHARVQNLSPITLNNFTTIIIRPRLSNSPSISKHATGTRSPTNTEHGTAHADAHARQKSFIICCPPSPTLTSSRTRHYACYNYCSRTVPNTEHHITTPASPINQCQCPQRHATHATTPRVYVIQPANSSRHIVRFGHTPQFAALSPPRRDTTHHARPPNIAHLTTPHYHIHCHHCAAPPLAWFYAQYHQ